MYVCMYAGREGEGGNLTLVGGSTNLSIPKFLDSPSDTVNNEAVPGTQGKHEHGTVARTRLPFKNTPKYARHCAGSDVIHQVRKPQVANEFAVPGGWRVSATVERTRTYLFNLSAVPQQQPRNRHERLPCAPSAI